MSEDVIKVSTVNKEVYEQLRYQISIGQIPPGEKITIRNIAERFGVSTMPVREAIRRLQDRGYECLIVEDCTGATDYNNHLAAIKMVTMQGGVFGSVSTSDDIIDYLDHISE